MYMYICTYMYMCLYMYMYHTHVNACLCHHAPAVHVLKRRNVETALVRVHVYSSLMFIRLVVQHLVSRDVIYVIHTSVVASS